MAVLEAMGVGLRPTPKGMELPPNPTVTQAARLVETPGDKLDRSQQRSY